MQLHLTYPSLFVYATRLGTDIRDQRGCSSRMYLFLDSYRHTLDDVASKRVSSSQEEVVLHFLTCNSSNQNGFLRFPFECAGSAAPSLRQKSFEHQVLGCTYDDHLFLNSLGHHKHLLAFISSKEHTYTRYQVSCMTSTFRAPPR